MELTGVVIAKGAPNRTKDGRTVMCSIVLSPEIGLVRLYPLRVGASVGVWSEIRCKVEKSSKDNRCESFRVIDSERIRKIESPRAKSDILESCLLRSGDMDPIDYQNSKKASICVVKVASRIGGSLEPREDDEAEIAQDFEDVWVRPQSGFPYKPYVSWTSFQGKKHRSHILAQEVYVAMLKNAAYPMRVFENMRIGDPDYQHWMVLGNMRDRRNVWVMVHLHRQKKMLSPTTTNFMIQDGLKGNWPYSQQEEINAKYVGPQQLLNFTT
jgi:hypothetical protein